jgi:hypothetical protein
MSRRNSYKASPGWQRDVSGDAALTMPVLTTSVMFTDTGHWLMEQRPAETKAAPKKFFERQRPPGTKAIGST